jgi:hypothetical protein
MAPPRIPPRPLLYRGPDQTQPTDAQRLQWLCDRRDDALRDPLKPGDPPAGDTPAGDEPAAAAPEPDRVSARTLLDRWRAADDEARVAETAVVEGSLRALDGLGACPSAQDRAKARALRQVADDLFVLAAAELKAEAAASGGHH